MAQYKVIVQKLNKRTYPVSDFSDKSNIAGIVERDFNFEGSEVTNLPNAALGKWFKDRDGYYYWGGGLIEITPDKQSYQTSIIKSYDMVTKQLIKEINYNDLLSLDHSLKSNLGNNILVGVLDHPINKDAICLVGAISNLSNYAIQPANDHGTFMAGLIAGRSGVKGIAPGSKIIELPFYDEYADSYDDWIIQRLEDMEDIHQKIVLNVSQSIPNLSAMVQKKIEELPDSIFVIAAAGTDDELLKDEIQKPANLQNVLAVGSISSGFKLPPNTCFNSKIDVLVPEFQYVLPTRKGSDKYAFTYGDSCACAIVSGIAAMILASGKFDHPTINDIKNEIRRSAANFQDQCIYTDLKLIKPTP
jgi:subtilisin family serine protease